MPHPIHQVKTSLLLCLAASCSLISACGDSDKKEDPAVVVYGTMTLSDSKAPADAATFSLTSAEKCSRNIESGRVDIILSQGAGKPALSLAIKDYSATAKTYTCTQAADNRASASDVGGKFESCMVDTKVLTSPSVTTLNGYSMYRETIAAKPFTYAASCTIEVSAATPSITGKVVCMNMVQTMLEGAARNPIDPLITADLAADFNCTFN